MMNPTQTQPDAMLRWMATLADATRVRLLRVAERQELGVSDLCAVLQMPQSTVSRHLKVLSDENWLSNRRQGTTNLYRMVLDEMEPAQRELWVLTRDRTAGWATLAQDEVRLAARLAEREADPRLFFDDAAAGWDHTRHELYGSTFGYEAIAGLLPSDWTVADLGCGTGRLIADLAPNVATVHGIDNSAEMLKAARAQTRGFGNVTLHRADLTALPLPDGGCDAATCVLVLTYLDQPGDVLAEMARVLKPGGKAVVVDLMRHDREDFRRAMGQRSMGFTSELLTQLMTDAGLSRPTCRPLAPAQDAKGPALLLACATRETE